MTNPMAQAWIDASNDLGIVVVHPFKFRTNNGNEATTQGVFLPDFGSPDGTLLLCRFDSDEIGELAEDLDYFQSGLSPFHYEPYQQEVFIEALNDWGWFGSQDRVPTWFAGAIGKHGGITEQKHD